MNAWLWGRTASYNKGVPQLEDDECGWDAAGLLETICDILCKGRAVHGPGNESRFPFALSRITRHKHTCIFKGKQK
ncbi:hypothetical protein Desde_0872 [Desulfitobacterium dehalogenans ATCC 51507]|uniref:Uncharacterized protein n=1 Tax=Desulfitobacterium dehalogenans (strain ATCC 51507 / DSM 9161 / JW/IU-DC1) TaxID=756499 RepID=I4A5S8_DESDJ|nr:hypothetical protein Desde_0872 [Desulfitobacterium dehalogenans ATCC 51507]